MKLELSNRPFVAFDAANKDHRRYFAEFQKTGTWSKSPVRFLISDDVGDLVTLIQRRLIDHYVTREFGKITA